MSKHTIQLGDLINAIYELVHQEIHDDEMATRVAALSTLDLLLHTDNKHAATLLLSP